ncbi:MAG: rRNA maturation RNase YbeY [Lachnospiraceae bacterium]|nr:rRNA maturation RNase YbeY [Lachnospiraceae bacterium]
MTIDIEFERADESAFSFDVREVIEQTIESALDHENCEYDVYVEVVLTDDEDIHEVNKETRNIDKATDVLSFPNCFFDVPGDFSNIEEQEDCFHPDTGELMLGDIMISVEHVFAQAKEYGHSVRRELAFLVAHSMLHLMGYDHMEEEERRVMEERQEAILERIGITRDSAD